MFPEILLQSAHSGGFMDWLKNLHPGSLALLVPIVAIIVGGIVGGTVAITFAMIRHRERLAMIEKGIHPDTKRHSHNIHSADQATHGRSV